MKYEVEYNVGTREEKDERAIQDMLEYLGTERTALFGDLVALAVCIEHDIPCESNDGEMRVQTVQGLNMTLSFGGISGRPFHAFCRRYCLNKYKEWLRSPSGGGGPVEPDEQGFWEAKA